MGWNSIGPIEAGVRFDRAALPLLSRLVSSEMGDYWRDQCFQAETGHADQFIARAFHETGSHAAGWDQHECR
jgi:hypothetical protein